MRTPAGIYVETEIQDEVDRLWLPTQDQALHQRWTCASAIFNTGPDPGCSGKLSCLPDSCIQPCDFESRLDRARNFRIVAVNNAALRDNGDLRIELRT